MSLPVLWSFRRCPYAMRARLAILHAKEPVELREILLRDKPSAFLNTSVTATVPALRLPDRVIDESLEIMQWALGLRDPEGILEMPPLGWELIAANDGPFKAALDHTKYASRYPELDSEAERALAVSHLQGLNTQLGRKAWLFGTRVSLADLAILPFVRQFANIDRARFDAEPWPELIGWLDRFCDSFQFRAIMEKYPLWKEAGTPIVFAGS